MILKTPIPTIRCADRAIWLASKDGVYTPLEGMLILDLENKTAVNISTPGLGGGGPRVGGTLEYIAPVGGMGILVALGGMVNPSFPEVEVLNASRGDLVSSLLK